MLQTPVEINPSHQQDRGGERENTDLGGETETKQQTCQGIIAPPSAGACPNQEEESGSNEQVGEGINRVKVRKLYRPN